VSLLANVFQYVLREFDEEEKCSNISFEKKIQKLATN